LKRIPCFPDKYKDLFDPHVVSAITKRGKIRRESLEFFEEKLLPADRIIVNPNDVRNIDYGEKKRGHRNTRLD